MSHKTFTKDEMYLIKLKELAEATGDTFDEVDCYSVGQAYGQKEKAVNNIVKNLAQANFLRKGKDNTVRLTPHGLKLVLSLFS